MTSSHVYVGAAAIGSKAVGGVFRQAAGDDRWQQMTKVARGDARPGDHRAPREPGRDLPRHPLATYRSTDRGERWERLDFPKDLEVWSILVHPGQPRSSSPAPRRSASGAATTAATRSGGCPGGPAQSGHDEGFACRVMRLAIDRARPDDIYAALEVGGAMRSLDGGETWDDCSAPLVDLAALPHLKSQIDSDTDIEGMLDGHAITSTRGAVYLAVRMGLFQATTVAERGVTWRSAASPR